jgi:hypothetical protein
MHDPIQEHQWDVRAAYRKGWEERMAYYDRLLRSVMELIQGTVKIMKVDGLSEAIEDLGKAKPIGQRVCCWRRRRPRCRRSLHAARPR